MGGAPTGATVGRLALGVSAGTVTHQASVSITLGPSLIANGTGVVVQAPTVSVLDGTTSLGSTTTLGNNPVCP